MFSVVKSALLVTSTFSVNRKVCDAKAVLRGSQFYQDTVAALKAVSLSFPQQTIGETICYGLGNFSECLIARYQLALLLLIKESFDSSVFVHDPIFYEAEVRLLEELGLHIILENEEGKRKLKEGVNTLLYFPHCSKQLTNNFLWCNWGPELKTCVLFGNSFSNVLSSELSSKSKANISFIQRIHPHTEEFELENNFKYQDIFNNTSIHSFPPDKLSALDPGFWEQCEEPAYGADDTEFIRNL